MNYTRKPKQATTGKCFTKDCPNPTTAADTFYAKSGEGIYCQPCRLRNKLNSIKKSL